MANRVEIRATLKDGNDWSHAFETPHGNSPHGMRSIEEECQAIVDDTWANAVERWFWQFNLDAKEEEKAASASAPSSVPAETHETSFDRAHLADTERLAAMVADHPLMGPQMAHRVEELRAAGESAKGGKES